MLISEDSIEEQEQYREKGTEKVQELVRIILD
jgi:hypothetical protein